MFILFAVSALAGEPDAPPVPAPAAAAAPLRFDDQPLVGSLPKPSVEIVLTRVDISERYAAQVEASVTDRILAVETKLEQIPR